MPSFYPLPEETDGGRGTCPQHEPPVERWRRCGLDRGSPGRDRARARHLAVLPARRRYAWSRSDRCRRERTESISTQLTSGLMTSAAVRSGRQRFPHRRRHLRSEQLDSAQYAPVRQCPYRELQQEALMAEDLVLIQDLVDDLLGTAHEVCAAQSVGGVELHARHWRPSALATDPVHRGLECGERLVGRGFGVGRDEAV